MTPRFASAKVQITSNHVPAEDILALSSGDEHFGNITASFDASTGTLKLLLPRTPLATVTQSKAALRAVTYTNTSDTPSVNARAVSFAASDGVPKREAPGRVLFSVTAVNDTPELANPIADQSVGADTAWSLVVPADAFSDVDSPTLTYSATRGDGAALPSSGSPFDGKTRTFTGTPPTGGNTVDLKVMASDGSATVADTFTLTIAAQYDDDDDDDDHDNRPPVAVDDTLTATEDALAIWSPSLLLANDRDADGDKLTVTNVFAAVGGTVASFGNDLLFTPARNFNGKAGFDPVSDGHGGFDTGHATVNVKSVNNAGAIAKQSLTTIPDTSLRVSEWLRATWTMTS